VDAMSLSKAMLNFEFMITLHTVEQYMSFTESLTRSLHARSLDLLQAVKHISVLKQVLSDVCSNIDEQFHLLFLNASKCAMNHDVAINTPRRCSRQTARENRPAENAEEHYRRSLAIPFLDHLKEEIEQRFTTHTVRAIRCLGIIPSSFESSEKANDDEMFNFFKEDVTFDSAVKAELQLWRSYFHDHVELPDTPQSSLKYTYHQLEK